MESADIDWDGNCKFDENGKVVGFLVAKNTNHYRMMPVPRDDKTMQQAMEADKTLNAIMQPASRDQIAIAIKKLSLHCGMQAKAPEDVKHLFLDYCIDLGSYPAKLIEDACKEYRTMPEGNQFMPSSGKLIGMMEPKMRKLKLMRKRIDKILGCDVEEVVKQNKPISIMEALERFKAN